MSQFSFSICLSIAWKHTQIIKSHTKNISNSWQHTHAGIDCFVLFFNGCSSGCLPPTTGFPVDCSKSSSRCLEECPSPRSGRHRAAKPDGKGDGKSREIILSLSLHTILVHVTHLSTLRQRLRRSEHSAAVICIPRSAAPLPSFPTPDNRLPNAGSLCW